MNDPPLPALQQQILDADTLDSLIRDLGQFASMHEIRGKSAARTRSAARELTLAGAVASLRRGELRGVQIRYVFDGNEWLDTLVATPEGIRVARLLVNDVGGNFLDAAIQGG